MTDEQWVTPQQKLPDDGQRADIVFTTRGSKKGLLRCHSTFTDGVFQIQGGVIPPGHVIRWQPVGGAVPAHPPAQAKPAKRPYRITPEAMAARVAKAAATRARGREGYGA